MNLITKVIISYDMISGIHVKKIETNLQLNNFENGLTVTMYSPTIVRSKLTVERKEDRTSRTWRWSTNRNRSLVIK